MAAYMTRRVLHAVIVVALITLASFLIIHLVPGDPVREIVGPYASPAAVRRVRRELGLDHSLIHQYLSFLGGIFHGRLGTSITLRVSVAGLIGPRVLPSVLLLTYATLISLIVAVPMGIIAALYRNRPVDHGVRVLTTVWLGMPAFWFGLVLVEIFSLSFHLFPVAGYGSGFLSHVWYLTLPAITLGIYLAPLVVRTLRSSLIETLSADYVTAARARGFRESRVVGKHGLRNALIATITILAINIGFLISGAVVVESVFNIPGLGSLLVSAIQQRDFATITGLTFVFGTSVVLINLLADLAYSAVDPRIRL